MDYKLELQKNNEDLNEIIDKAKALPDADGSGGGVKATFATSVSGYIPENYVENDIEKLNLYQRIYNAKTLNEMKKLEEELKDMYGKLPREVENIVLKRQYEILCTSSFIEDVADQGDFVSLKLSADFSLNVKGDELFALIHRLFKKPQIKYSGGHIVILIPTIGQWLSYAIELINELNKMNG
jgi:transcription-repair coupling factor (superfamily II helicase)